MNDTINRAINKTYKILAKNKITQNLNHFGRGREYLNKAHDQKNLNLSCSALLYKEAVNNLKIAHKNHPTSGEVKKTLAQACREYEEILAELSLSEKDHLPNKESDDLQLFIENQFFQKNYYVTEKHIPLGEDDEPNNTQQLACELRRKNVSDEQKKKLCRLAQKIIERFAKIDTPTLELVHEVMVLSHLPDAEEELYRHLVNIFIYKINQFGFLFPSLLEGLSHIIRQANPKHLKPNDLVYVLNVLNEKFKNLHTQDKDQQIEMTRTLGRLFDVMADCEVQDLKYEETYKPLYDTFKKLNNDNNQELAYLSGYACQALVCIPNDESPWKAFQRRGGKVFLGITKLAGAIKNIDPGKLPDVFKDLSEGFEGIINMAVDLVDLVKEIQSAKESASDIKQSFNWEIQRKWYWALRFTDLFIQSHKFASLEQFIYKIPCRQDDKFLWGLCERFERLAADSELEINIRKGAMEFLDSVCQNKDFWGAHPKLNKWILEHIELKTSPKCVHTIASSFPNALLKDILCEQALYEFVRPTQQNDLRKSGRELLAQLNGLKDQFFSDVDDEFDEALELYVKPRGTWKASVIKSSNSVKEMVSESREGDVEDVVNRFLESKGKLTSNNIETLEVATNELLNSKDAAPIIKIVDSFFAPENKLTLEDEKVLKKVANQFLDLKVNKAPELQEKITNEFLHSSKNKEELVKTMNNVLKENPITMKDIADEDVKFLEIEANKCLTSNDKNIFESVVNKFLASKAKKILEITVNKIVASKCRKVLLILGIGGTGKSTFSRYLARCLWQKYDQLNTSQSLIPLFIPLARLKEKMFNNDEDFIELYLKEKCKLSPDKIDVLRERKFVFILDGYDEIAERERHCYIKNKFCEWKNAKIIISCRPEYLGSDYQKRFFPQNGKKGFQELTIKAFSETEVQQYITKYVQNKRHLLDWSEDTFLQQIKRVPEDLVSNPILLKITLTTLPRFTKQEKTTQINRIALYDEFLKTWFDRAQDRLHKIHKTNKEEEAFSNLNINDFTESCLQFSKNFAVQMFIDNNKVVIAYNSNWATFLGNKDIENSLLRFSMPLIRRENQYWFLHKSLRDHLIAQALLEPCESALNTALFNKQSFVSEHGVRQFLSEHIYQKVGNFKPQLLAFIEASKKDDEIQIASANAITILTQVDVLLDNLNDTNISGADLSNKIFNNLQAERTKLNNVNFQNTELNNANLRNSSLQNASFQNARLQNTDLRGSSFQNAHFNDADLSFADFRNTILQDVNFRNAKLRNTSLQNACIKNADLTFADLQNTILVDINFQKLSTENVNFEKDEYKAFVYCQKLADMNDSSGIYNVGYCYQNGIGVEKDEQKAFVYYQKSAEMGNASGTCSIGYCYRHGIGVEKDEHKAFIYYQRSADMGDANGMCNVGYCYQNGIGVEKDEYMAFTYYLESAELGCYGGMYHVGYCYRNGSGTSQDFEKASEWLYKAKTNKRSYEMKPYTENDGKCLVPQIPINEVEIYGKIGEGGFANVYLARWKSNGLTQPIALKLLHKQKENYSELNMFYSIASKNPTFLQCHGLLKNETGDYFLVMQYARMGPLNKNLHNVAQMDWDKKLNLLSCIAFDFQSIHSNNMIHCDLHSGNIFQDDLYNAYVGDFNLAKLCEKISKTKALFGVLPYIAPEVLYTNGKEYTQKSDIYSFGIIMSEVSTGYPPYYDAPHDVDLATRICLGYRPKIRCDIPQLLFDLMNKCLDADPQERPTAKELGDTLHQFIEDMKNEETELSKQVKNLDKNFLSYDQVKSTRFEYQTHPQAIYTSRFLNLSKLPKPVNAVSQPVDYDEVLDDY